METDLGWREYVLATEEAYWNGLWTVVCDQLFLFYLFIYSLCTTMRPENAIYGCRYCLQILSLMDRRGRNL
jgi:hypothetical protein